MEKYEKMLESMIRQFQNKKIMFYGASLFLENFLKKHPIIKNVIGIIDKDSNKINKDFCGYKVFPPSYIETLKPDNVILTIVNNNQEIYLSLFDTIFSKHPEIEFSSIAGRYSTNVKYYCPFCDKELYFFDFGKKTRPNVKCSVCGSLERHRFLYFIYKEIIKRNQDKHLTILHTAPEKCIYNFLKEQSNIEYTTIDINPEKYTFANNCLKMDILDLKFPPETFDYIFTNHVIEHIPDESGFFRECFKVLKPNGKIILTAPYFEDLEKTLEDPAINTDEKRLKYYGQKDHVRKYGKDIFDRFKQYGNVTVIEKNYVPSDLRTKMNITEKENAIIISKQ